MSTVPFPPLIEHATSFLDVSVRISDSQGWLLAGRDTQYPIHRESFNQVQRTQRRTVAQNPFVPGTFTVNSTPDNVTENVSLWVLGDTHFEMDRHRTRLVDAFEQVSYLMVVTIEDLERTWYCFAADVQVNTQAEYLHATRCLVTAQVPRLPYEERHLV